MVLVAIAGGTSPTLGRSIVRGLKDAGKHDAVILSRQKGDGETDGSQTAQQPTTDTKWGAPIRYVDYSSVDSLTEALKGVNTCISVLNVTPGELSIQYHRNLMTACLAAGVKRFTPSDWGAGFPVTTKMDLLDDRYKLFVMCQREAVPKGLECMMVHAGLFLNYFGRGSDFSSLDAQKTEVEEDFVLAGLKTDKFFEKYIDISKGVLRIPVVPGTNNNRLAQVSVTHLHDVGKYMAAAIDLPPKRWNGAQNLHSQACTFEHIRVLLNEEVNPGFQLTYQPITVEECDKIIAENNALLAKDQGNMDAIVDRMAAQFMKFYCIEVQQGTVFGGSLSGMLPEVEPVSVFQYLIRAWRRPMY